MPLVGASDLVRRRSGQPLTGAEVGSPYVLVTAPECLTTTHSTLFCVSCNATESFMHPFTKSGKVMSIQKIKQRNISYSSAEKHAVKGGNNFVAHRNNPMCTPSKRTSFVKVNKTRRKPGGGGYAPVPFGETENHKRIDVPARDPAYSDFILYNYGAASERQNGAGSENAS